MGRVDVADRGWKPLRVVRMGWCKPLAHRGASAAPTGGQVDGLAEIWQIAAGSRSCGACASGRFDSLGRKAPLYRSKVDWRRLARTDLQGMSRAANGVLMAHVRQRSGTA